MKEIVITSSREELILDQLNLDLKGTLTENWGEHVLSFDTELGIGVVRNIAFDRGVSLLDFNVCFTEDVKIMFRTLGVPPIEFIFISEGTFKYRESETDDYVDLEQYQNIIIAPDRSSEKAFFFPRNRKIQVNFIRILKKEYLKKKNNNVSYLNTLLLSIFNDGHDSIPYRHRGSFSLKIADEVKALNAVYDSGIIRTLSLEGRLYLILALQLIEHHNYENRVNLPESLSRADIKKINQLSEYIVDNISNPLSVNHLAQRVGLSPKKLQLGFRVLYAKSVNEYIRQLRLEIARDFLKNSDLSVSEIVYAIGIKSRSYFSKIFYEAYGILPTKYRKKLLNKD